MVFGTLGLEQEIQEEWCESYLHKWLHGSTRESEKQENVEHSEYFCKKCGKKTAGFTTFTYEFEIEENMV